MRAILWLLVGGLLVAGCTLKDENPKWNPKGDLPEWAYDAPLYYRPSEDLKPEKLPNGMEVYYTPKEYFFIQHPTGYQVRGEPRMSVWSSTDQGKAWDRAGFYGVEQTHFLFKAEQDGPVWIRFVGPGQAVPKVPPGSPNRIYIVDRMPPAIHLTVDPSPIMDDKGTRRTYRVGQRITLRWAVTDAYLDPATIKLEICFVKFPQNLVWGSIPQALPPTGSMVVEVPPEAATEGGLRFRMEACDKAGNLGLAVTEVLQVASGGGRGAASQPAARPAGPFESAPGEATMDTGGWPRAGTMLRGGAGALLSWTPPSAGDYDSLMLQFSTDDARTWRDVGTTFKAGQSIKWTVPTVNSKDCRLRILGLRSQEITLDGKPSSENLRIVLVTSGPFTVDTIIPDSVFGPTTLPADKKTR